MIRLLLAIALSMILLLSVQALLSVISLTSSSVQTQDPSDTEANLQDLIPTTVVKVIDGDTLRLRDDTHAFTAKLAFIDAPEREQPFGRESKNHLKNLLRDSNVLIQPEGDEWVIFQSGENINFKQLQQGYAWPSEAIMLSTQKTATVPSNAHTDPYLSAYQTASENLRGLWAQEHDLRISPWQWRKQTVEVSPRQTLRSNLTNPFAQPGRQEQQKYQAQKEQVLREIAKQKAAQKKRPLIERNLAEPPSNTTQPNESSTYDKKN